MKKIGMVFNHLNNSDGVSKTAIGIANALVKNRDIEIDLIPLYRCDYNMKTLLSKQVHIKPVFRFYFRGMDKMLNKIDPRLLYEFIFHNRKYDYEIAFQENLPTKIIAYSKNKQSLKYAWVHVVKDNMDLENYRRAYKKVICVSKYNAEYLRKLLPDYAIDYAYNPINSNEIILKGKSVIPLKKQKFTFVSVGRMHPQKGYERLLNVINDLNALGYDFELWLIGAGELFGQLRLFAKEHRLNNVVFIGETNNPYSYVSNADIFVCSSLYEGYSTACTEAVILGIPVLTTDVSGGREIIEEAKSGMLVENSEIALLNGMRHILDHKELVHDWKETLKRTSDRFSYLVRTQTLLEKLDLDVDK